MLRTAIAAIFSLLGVLLALPVVICALPFWTVALLTRLIHEPLRLLLRSTVMSWDQLIEYEPVVGWKPKPNLNVHAHADQVFHLTTDARGWRGKTTLAESDIVVFGDSYAFGYGVSDKSFFAELNPQLKIKSIGAQGYNMVQSLLWMRFLRDELRGKLVVWFIYFGNDLYENLQPNMRQYRMPFVRAVNGRGSWEIVTSHVNSSSWSSNLQRDYYARLAEICTPTFLSQRACSACEFLIREGRDICNQAGAQLLIMTVPDITQISQSHMKKLAALAPDPHRFDPNLPDLNIRAMCRKLGVPFVTLKDHLGVEDHKEHDAHWNERGHKHVADVLNDLYRHYVSKEGTS
jgi:hypothetical protein